MAAYGSQIAQGKSEDEALDFVAQVLENTPVQDASARDALQTFIGGKGDVLLSYENEAIGAIDAGEERRVHRPRRDDPDRDQGAPCPRRPTTPRPRRRSSTSSSPTRASAPGPRSGYRPVNEEILAEYEDEFPEPKDLFTIEEFGGWDTVATEFFDPEAGSVAEIERNLGVATE